MDRKKLLTAQKPRHWENLLKCNQHTEFSNVWFATLQTDLLVGAEGVKHLIVLFIIDYFKIQVSIFYLPEVKDMASFILCSLIEKLFAVFVLVQSEVGREVCADCKRTHFSHLFVLVDARGNHFSKFFLKKLNHVAETLLNIPQNIILLLCDISDVLWNSARVIWPKLEVCAEQLCLVDQVVVSHHILDFFDHGSYDFGVDLLQLR